jgi:Spy/CpxP family protein refolding chaperone
MLTYFTKNKLTAILALVLIVSNLLVLGYVLLRERRPQGPHGDGPPGPHIQEMLRDELKMTDAQFSAYQSLIEKHRDQRKACKEEMQKLRKDLLLAIGTPGGDSAAQAASLKIGEVQARFEVQTYEHFKQVYELLDDSQKKEFGKFMGDVAGKLEKLEPGPPPPPRRE